MILQNNTIKFVCSISFIFVSCMDEQKSSQSIEASNENVNNNRTVAMLTKAEQEQKNIKQLKYFYFKDTRNGMKMERIPFPATWERPNSGEYDFTGPNGIKAYAQRGEGFQFFNDPYTQNVYTNAGIALKNPLSMEESIEELIMPTANKLNRKMVKKYPIPQLLEGYKNFIGMIYKYEQNPIEFDGTAIEWVDPDGTKWITIFFHHIERSRDGGWWGYSVGAIGAPGTSFQQAKQDYLNGLLNKQINPAWVTAMNQQTEYAIRKNQENTNRFIANQKAAEAERLKAWEQRMKDDRLYMEHFTDVLIGKVNIIDPESGTKHNIDNTHQQYWVNSQNKYVGTNTPYEDPNKNSFINGETWREFKVDDYKN